MIKLVNNEEFSKLKEEWNALLKESSSNNLFLTWEWTFYYWKYFQNQRKLMILLVKEDDKLIAIAPLCRSSETHSKMNFNQIEFIGSKSSLDYLDFIIEKGKEEKAIKEISDYLKNLDWDCLFFDNYPISFPSISLIQKQFQNNYIYLDKKGMGFSILLPNSFDSYLRSLGKNTKKSAKRYTRKISKEFKINFDYADNNNFEEYMSVFLKLHAEQFKDKKDGFTEPKINFIKEVSKEALNDGYLRLYSLKLNGKPVSLLHCFNYNNKIYHFNGGCDIRYARYSVGFVRFLYAIENAIKEGAKEFDFLMGDQEYKKRLGNKTTDISYLIIFKKNLKGFLTNFIYKFKELIKI